MMDLQEIDVAKGVWYLLQTNYDNWEEPPFYDDRRTPGKICMKEMGQKKTGTHGGIIVFNLNVITVCLNCRELTSFLSS